MKYCINFDKSFSFLDEVDEIRINYDKQKDEAIKYLMDKDNKQTIILFVEDMKNFNFERFSELNKTNSNFKIEFKELNEDYREKLKKVKFKFYIAHFAATLEEFYGLIELGVSDIIIFGELGFKLEQISKVAKEHNIEIRCYCNLAQFAWHYEDKIENLKSFFIRPEDVSAYEKYIDILFFYGEREKIPVYYKIYSKDKKWFGKLNEIINFLDVDIDSRFIIPAFTNRRINCQKKCLQGGKCSICSTVYKLSKSLEEAKLGIKNEEEENK